MQYLELFIALLAVHLLADFPFQSDFVARWKDPCRAGDCGEWPWVMAAHAATHGVGVYLVTGSFGLALLEFLWHFAIDYYKCLGVFGFQVDQWLHVACKAVWTILVVVGYATWKCSFCI